MAFISSGGREAHDRLWKLLRGTEHERSISLWVSGSISQQTSLINSCCGNVCYNLQGEPSIVFQIASTGLVELGGDMVGIKLER
jgi:hypothetical protein